jgi:hypothetical protein
MQSALKTYTATDDLPIMSIILILFISGNIVTWMIFLMDKKSMLAKSLWTAGLILVMVVLNLIVM